MAAIKANQLPRGIRFLSCFFSYINPSMYDLSSRGASIEKHSYLALTCTNMLWTVIRKPYHLVSTSTRAREHVSANSNIQLPMLRWACQAAEGFRVGDSWVILYTSVASVGQDNAPRYIFPIQCPILWRWFWTK